MPYARVLIDRAIRRELDYAIPENLADRVNIGWRVRVPFRDHSALATVVALVEETAATNVRPIEAIVGERPALSPKVLELARWMSAYYCCPIETVMRSLLPQVIRRAEVGWKKQLFVRATRAITAEEIEKLRKRAPRQAEMLEAISRHADAILATDLLRETSLDNTTLRSLQKRGWIELRAEAVPRDPHSDEQFVASTDLVLNAEQAVALAAVEEALVAPESARPLLLHGVTGSGKTEIYLQAISSTLARGKTAIVLVPEISLTPQTVERFKSRFTDT
ncbi:MAG: DEAD/DEAH box helicase family protein, partial [Chthoniobacterales bacterium]